MSSIYMVLIVSLGFVVIPCQTFQTRSTHARGGGEHQWVSHLVFVGWVGTLGLKGVLGELSMMTTPYLPITPL